MSLAAEGISRRTLREGGRAENEKGQNNIFRKKFPDLVTAPFVRRRPGGFY